MSLNTCTGEYLVGSKYRSLAMARAMTLWHVYLTSQCFYLTYSNWKKNIFELLGPSGSTQTNLCLLFKIFPLSSRTLIIIHSFHKKVFKLLLVYVGFFFRFLLNLFFFEKGFFLIYLRDFDKLDVCKSLNERSHT